MNNIKEVFNDLFNKLDIEFNSTFTRAILKNEFYIITKLFSYMSSCAKTRQAALIIKDNRIISFGYNGSPQQGLNCIEHKEQAQLICGKDNSGSCLHGIHAEQNAIAFAAKEGISLKDCEIYITQSPCISCAKLIIASGIRKVLYIEPYRLNEGLNFLIQYNIQCEQVSLND